MIIRGGGLHPLNRKYYFLEIMLPGYAKPLRFEIDPADGERLQQVLELPAEELDFFFSLTTKDGQHVMFSVQDIQLANFLWESCAYIARKRWRLPRIKICFRDQSTPFQDFLGDASWLQIVRKTETLGEDPDEAFLSFLNVDGDEIYFRPSQVLLLAYTWEERINVTTVDTRVGVPEFDPELAGVFGAYVWQMGSEEDVAPDESWYGHLDFVVEDENASYDYEFETYGPYPTKSQAVAAVQQDFGSIVGLASQNGDG
jgi:hypothetical protein